MKNLIRRLVLRHNAAASGLVLHCLPMSHKKDARLKLVNCAYMLNNELG